MKPHPSKKNSGAGSSGKINSGQVNSGAASHGPLNTGNKDSGTWKSDTGSSGKINSGAANSGSRRSGTGKIADWTVAGMLSWGTDFFRSRKVPSPRLSIEWLLSDVLSLKRLDLYLQYDRPLSSEEKDRLRPLILRRANHEPLQYITGYTDFHRITLRVTPDVLIPRPETEQLVERILEDHGSQEPLRFLDAGTGSGCIALAVKKARPAWDVTAIDISQEALAVARENAASLGLDISFQPCGFETFRTKDKMGIIASNPPYVHPEDAVSMQREVLEYEPREALFVEDAETLYKGLLAMCRDNLDTNGAFYFEINESDGAHVQKLCNDKPFTARLLRDYSGKDRFISGRFE